jgi:hypothetical protein
MKGRVKVRQKQGRLHRSTALDEVEEMTEADALARLQTQEDALRSAIVVRRCDCEKDPDWTPEDIGRLVQLIGDGARYEDAGHALGRSAGAVSVELSKVRKWISPDRPRSHTSRKQGRPRGTTPEQEERIHELRLGGATIPDIAKDVGVGEGCVRWVIAEVDG